MTQILLNKFNLNPLREVIKRFPTIAIWTFLSSIIAWWEYNSPTVSGKSSWRAHILEGLVFALLTCGLIDFFVDWVKHRKKNLPRYLEKILSTDVPRSFFHLSIKVALLIGLFFIFAFYFALAVNERQIGIHILLLGSSFFSLYLALSRFYFLGVEEWQRVLVGFFVSLAWRTVLALLLYGLAVAGGTLFLLLFGFSSAYTVLAVALCLFVAFPYWVGGLCLDLIAIIREKREIRFESVMKVLGFALVLYLGILYLYSVKVLVDQKWPEGWIAPLVVSSVVGTLAFSLYYRVVCVARHEVVLRRWLLPLMVVPLAMMLTSLYIRISNFGLTETRWAAVGLSSLFLIVACISVFKEVSTKKMLEAISFTCLALSVGPFSSFEIAEWDRKKSFIQISELALAKKSLSRSQERKFLGSVEFLCARHQEEFIDSWATKNALKIRTKDGCSSQRYAEELKINSKADHGDLGTRRLSYSTRYNIWRHHAKFGDWINLDVSVSDKYASDLVSNARLRWKYVLQENVVRVEFLQEKLTIDLPVSEIIDGLSSGDQLLIYSASNSQHTAQIWVETLFLSRVEVSLDNGAGKIDNRQERPAHFEATVHIQ